MNTATLPRPSPPRRGLAFTLTEILIAIALIVAVVALAVANLNKIYDANEQNIAKVFVTQTVQTPLLAYKMATGSYPTTDQGFQALITAPDGVTSWKGPYLDPNKIPVDPWQHPYQYAYPGPHNGSDKPDVWSNGEDGQPGSVDNIVNW